MSEEPKAINAIEESRKNFSDSKKKNISRDEIYQQFNGKSEPEILGYFAGKGCHCVKCKAALGDSPAIVYPVNNTLSLSIVQADGKKKFAVPYFKCAACQYDNSVHKLILQTI